MTTIKKKILAARYLIESFLFGHRHDTALVKACVKPQKTFERPSILGMEFIRSNYSEEALADFKAINKIISDHHAG